MHYTIIFALLVASAFATEEQHYSFNPMVGSNSGTSYSITGDERITAVRVWDNSNYIYGIQLRYGDIWSQVAGYSSGTVSEFVLYEDEAIIQVSGKFSHYINWLVFVTNKGRSMFTGQPSGTNFNMYPEHEGAELRFISGTYHGAITGFSTHWATVPDPSEENGH